MSARPEIQPGERRLLPSGRLVQVLDVMRRGQLNEAVLCRYVGPHGVLGKGQAERNEVSFLGFWLQKYGVRV